MSWLDELKVGDRVVISRGYGLGAESLSTVTRVTATLIVCGQLRFRKRSGYAPGDNWSRSCLIEPTQDVLDRVEERNLRQRINRASEDATVTLESLRKIAAAIDKEPTNDH